MLPAIKYIDKSQHQGWHPYVLQPHVDAADGSGQNNTMEVKKSDFDWYAALKEDSEAVKKSSK